MEAKQISKAVIKGCRVITDIFENCWKKMWSVFLPMTSAKNACDSVSDPSGPE